MSAGTALQSGIHDRTSGRPSQQVQPPAPKGLRRRRPWEPEWAVPRPGSRQVPLLQGRQPPVLLGQLQALRAAAPWQGRPELRQGRQHGA